MIDVHKLKVIQDVLVRHLYYSNFDKDQTFIFLYLIPYLIPNILWKSTERNCDL